MDQQTCSDTALKMVRTFSAAPEEVYAAWADPQKMVRWMGPGDVKCKAVDIDLRVGGKYTIQMLSKEGEHTAVGEYKEISPNKKLQFTWAWKEKEMPDTLVTIEFEGAGESTKLTLTHENFHKKEVAAEHHMGWNGCFDHLNGFLSQK